MVSYNIKKFGIPWVSSVSFDTPPNGGASVGAWLQEAPRAPPSSSLFLLLVILMGTILTLELTVVAAVYNH
jgi:hypothetical protein